MKLIYHTLDSLIKKIITFIIFFYKLFLSPILGNNCRFYPSCSQYMLDAINKKGSIIGIFMGIHRILRCNPWCKNVYDPVSNVKQKKL